MSYPNLQTVKNAFAPASLASEIPNVAQVGQEFGLSNAGSWSEVDENGNANGVPLGQSGPFVVELDSEQILCASFKAGIVVVFDDDGTDGRAYDETTIAVHAPGAAVTLLSTSVQSQIGSASSVQWVDLGLVDLVSAIMDGPTTLYDMPAGSFLASIRFADDPATVSCDVQFLTANGGITYSWPVFGTAKSFGWNGFAGLGVADDADSIVPSYDSLEMSAKGSGYGPFAALDTGTLDRNSLVLSAAAVGPVQVGLETLAGTPSFTIGTGVRTAAITPWAAATNYDSPASNTVSTPGVLQKCAILENGTIWINDGTTGTSGGSAPDFAGNAGGSATDGGTAASVLADAPPTLPTTIITGTNDTFLLNSETFTLAAGVLTTEADAIAAMGAALGSDSGEAFSTKVTPSDSSGSILATAVLGESVSNGSTIAEGNGAAAILGFTELSDTFAGGTGIVWYDTTSAPPTVGAVHVVAEIVTPITP